MTNKDIIAELQQRHERFTANLVTLQEAEFMFSFDGKWTAGQQLDHIRRSVQPLVLALRLPKFALRLAFGTANRPSREYDALVEKYHAKLAAGGSASARFMPLAITYSERENLRTSILTTVQHVCKALDRFTEDDLDRYVLPHPLLSKITIREMMYFTVYHVEHHQALTDRNLTHR
jgi:hypothetical protein